MLKLHRIVFAIMNLLILVACQTKTDEDIVAETSVGIITQMDFYGQLVDRYGAEVLEDMITIKVLSDMYEVSDEAIQDEVDAIHEQVADQFEQWIEQQGFASEKDLISIIQLSLLQEEAVAQHLNISEDELKEKYDRLSYDIEAHHILVNESDVAQSLYERLENGEDFVQLANEFSIDVDADEGGYLGYFSIGDTAPEFEDVAYRMKVGEVSEPVRTSYGYHIIKVTDRREVTEDIGSFEDMKKSIRRLVIQEKVTAEEEQQIIQSILDHAEIDIKKEELKHILTNGG